MKYYERAAAPSRNEEEASSWKIDLNCEVHEFKGVELILTVLLSHSKSAWRAEDESSSTLVILVKSKFRLSVLDVLPNDYDESSSTQNPLDPTDNITSEWDSR